MVFQKRLQSIRKIMSVHKTGSVLLSSREDIFYYTGYKASEGNLLLIQNSGRPVLFVSPLENDAEHVRNVDLVYLTSAEQLTKRLKENLVGYDEYNLSANRFLLLHKNHIHLKKFSAFIKKPREIKDSEEIENIKQAIRVSGKILNKLKLYNKTEINIADKMEAGFRLNGAEKAFDTIVANGTGSIHHPPENRLVKKKKPTIVDFGARYNWYCCDITRSWPGTENKWKTIFENVENIQKELIDFIKPGIPTEDIKKLYENLMIKHKYKIYHSFGHGFGLDVHEQITSPLKEGMVITVEPGVYLKRFGGIRIEDDILVRKNKSVVLTGRI